MTLNLKLSKLNIAPLFLILFMLLCPLAYAEGNPDADDVNDSEIIYTDITDDAEEALSDSEESDDVSDEDKHLSDDASAGELTLNDSPDLSDDDNEGSQEKKDENTNVTSPDGEVSPEGTPLVQSGETPSTGNENINYTISSIKLEKVDNQDYTGKSEVNCAFSFTFRDEASGTEYDCYITGIQVSAESCDGIIADVNNSQSESVYRTDLKNTAGKIIAFYLRSHSPEDSEYSVSISNKVNDTDSWYDLIDAEKYSVNKGGSAGVGEPYGDSDLCWAASSSNLLEYTGWSEGKTEDQVLTSFANKFFNNGFWSYNGLKWYLNKVNTKEYINSESGDIKLQDNSSNNTNERNTATGNYSYGSGSYAAENLLEDYKTSSGTNSEDFYNIFTDDIRSGNGVELSYLQTMAGQASGSHSVTLFGYIKEALKEGANALKALFISDSDTDYCTTQGDAVRDASQSESARAAKENKYTLYYADIAEDIYGRNTYIIRKGVVTPPDGAKDYISGATVLESSKSMSSTAADTGTKDSISNPDIVPLSIKLYNENPSVGDNVDFEATFMNSSYKALGNRSSGCMPVVNYSVLLYDENKNLIGQTSYSNEFVSFDGMLKSADYKTLQVSSSGTYYVGLRVDSCGYHDYTKDKDILCQESYLGNNTLKLSQLVRMVVSSGDEDDKSPEKSESSGVPDGPVKIVSAIYHISSGNKLEVNFSVWGNPGSFISLLDYDGREISSDYYSVVSNDDGSFTVIFTSEFLNSLPYGTNRFVFETTYGITYIDVSTI